MKVSETHPSWVYVANATNYLLQQTNGSKKSLSEDQLKGINSTIILNSAVMVEGAVKYILTESMTIHSYVGQVQTRFDIDLLQDLKRRIKKTSWGDLKKLSELVLGEDISHVYSNSKPLNILMQFRNVIAHGSSIDISYRIPNAIEGDYTPSDIDKTPQNVVGYLIDKNFVDKKLGIGNVGNDRANFFTCQIADHFYTESKKFTIAYVNAIPNRSGKVPFIQGRIHKIFE